MLQLMENVYLDLRLDDNWDHPDNEGWRNMFLSWSKSAAMQKTWSVSFKTFGLRFQYFCARRLGFSLPGQNGEDGAVLSARAKGDEITTKAVPVNGASHVCSIRSAEKWSQLQGEITPCNFGSLL